MAAISPEFVERYQLEFQRNPRSRIFAPLAEAYRQMGLLDEAVQVCSTGVQFNPDFAGGRVAFGKVLLTRGELEKALTQLEKAALLAPDNLLAQSLLAETLLKARRPKDALNAYKMVLLINPNDSKARSAVRKWEFLSADDYDAELFSMRPLFSQTDSSKTDRLSDTRTQPTANHPTKIKPQQDTQDARQQAGANARRNRLETALETSRRGREIERAVSLADAFTVRGDFLKAKELLEKARETLGENPEIDKRIGLLARRAGNLDTSSNADGVVLDLETRQARIHQLETFLQRITERRRP